MHHQLPHDCCQSPPFAVWLMRRYDGDRLFLYVPNLYGILNRRRLLVSCFVFLGMSGCANCDGLYCKLGLIEECLDDFIFCIWALQNRISRNIFIYVPGMSMSSGLAGMSRTSDTPR